MTLRAGSRHRRLSRQRGVALVTILFVVALISAIAYQLMQQQALTISQARAAFNGSQARHFALGAEALARQALFEDFNNADTRDSDHLQELWARPLAPFEIEAGYLEVQLTDLHRCFNLNALAETTLDDGESPEVPAASEGSEGTPGSLQPLPALKALLRSLALDDNLADAIKDWVDSDQEVTDFGAEDSDYLIAEPTYRTPNRAMVDIDALRAVKGVDDDVFRALSPHVCARPDSDLAINVNTVTAQAMMALSDQMTLAKAEPFAGAERLYTDVASVVQELPELAPATAAMVVRSEYFALDVRAEYDGSRVEMRSVLRRKADGEIQLVSRDFGRQFTSRLRFTTDDEGGA